MLHGLSFHQVDQATQYCIEPGSCENCRSLVARILQTYNREMMTK